MKTNENELITYQYQYLLDSHWYIRHDQVVIVHA